MPSGVVQIIEGEYAVVQIQRQDMCGDCHACDAVHVSQSCTLKCINSIKSEIGDLVEISLDNTTFLKATYIIYGLPLLGLGIGIALGYFIASFFPNINNELFMIAGAGLGMLITFLIIKSQDKKNKYKKMLPHIVKIINSTH